MCHLILFLPIITLPMLWFLPLSIGVPLYGFVLIVAFGAYVMVLRAMRRRAIAGPEALMRAIGEVRSVDRDGIALGDSLAHAEMARTANPTSKERQMSSTRMILRWTAAVLAMTTLAACQPAGPGGALPAATQTLPTAARNGARIYFTATSDRGTAITYTGGPDIGGGMTGGGMMGGGGRWLTCASCHGPEGRGGIHTMHMRVMKAPDIRYAALANMSELKGRSRPYDLEDFRKTIESGRHPDGEALDGDMPRWQMSEADLGDLFAFLKSLPK